MKQKGTQSAAYVYFEAQKGNKTEASHRAGLGARKFVVSGDHGLAGALFFRRKTQLALSFHVSIKGVIDGNTSRDT